jgi:putative CocE/NonD family hydrolase
VGAGLAVVLVDARGSGASQGHVLAIFSREERRDLAQVLAWIARQPWSDGRVVTTGVSYDGNLAALAVAAPGRALAAAAPRFIDFDTYRDLAVPGGVRNEMLLQGWGALTDSLNLATACVVSAAACADLPNLKPVDGDADLSVLRAALLDHQSNWRPYADTGGYAFEDDVTPAGRDLREGFLSTQIRELAASRVPVQLWGSWFDAGTADSALAWFAAAPEAKIEVYLGAWTHGVGARVDPFHPGPGEDEPGAPAPAERFLDFLARALGRPQAVTRVVHYYTAGAAVWRTTPVWPPANLAPVRWYFGPGDALSRDPPATGGADRYAVDFTATTGKTNRWTTQLGGGPVDYGDRADEDRKLLTYTSAPLARGIEVTGAPVVTLRLASTHPDGAVFAYLEAVAPGGRSIYLSEGVLRLPLRGGASAANTPPGVRPSFLRADMAPLAPGRTVEVGVMLHVVSAVVPQGYRLRIAIGGGDADTFARYPAEGDPTLTIHRSAAEPSFVDLPQADWTGVAR